MSPEGRRNLALILGRDPFETLEEVPSSPETTSNLSDAIGSAAGIPGLALPKGAKVTGEAIHRRRKRWQCA